MAAIFHSLSISVRSTVAFELKEAICLQVLWILHFFITRAFVGAVVIFWFAGTFGKIQTSEYEIYENFDHSMNMMHIKMSQEFGGY